MKSDYTHLALVVDRSGSMYGIHTDMNGAIAKMMEDQAAEPGDITVDVIAFNHEIDVRAEDVDPTDVPKDVIQPAGNTALLDAIGFTITRLGRKFKLMSEDERPEHVIVVVVTDGMENASHEYNRGQIKDMVDEQTEKWNWKFIYLAANVDAFATGGGMGFAKGSTAGYTADRAGTQSVYAATSNLVSATRSGLDATFTDEQREAAKHE